MSTLFDDLANSARPAAVGESHYSRTRKRLIVTLRQGVNAKVDFSIPLTRLDEAIDVVTAYSDSGGATQLLLEQFLNARHEFGHLIWGGAKARGIHDGRRLLYEQLKYASAWAYVMLERQMKVPSDRRLEVIKKAEEKIDRSFGKLQVFEQRVYLTALFVEMAYGAQRRAEGLVKRFDLDTYDGFEPRSWYRDYIKPNLATVRLLVAKNPSILDSLSNPYLRQLFSERNI